MKKLNVNVEGMEFLNKYLSEMNEEEFLMYRVIVAEDVVECALMLNDYVRYKNAIIRELESKIEQRNIIIKANEHRTRMLEDIKFDKELREIEATMKCEDFCFN